MHGTIHQLQELLEEARHGGARGVELLYQQEDGVQLEAVRGRVERRSPLHAASLEVRCWTEGGRSGQAVGAFDKAEKLIASALKAAAGAEEDPFAGPVGRLQLPSGGLGIEDPRHERLTDEDRADVVLTAEKSARSVDRRVVTGRFTYQERRVIRNFVNSKGIAFEEASTRYDAAGSVEAAQDGVKVCLSGGIEGRSFASIASLPFGVGMARQATELLGPARDVSGPVRVMLAPHATGRLFARLAEEFRVGHIGSDQTFLKVLPKDRPLLDPGLHLVDDGTLPGGLHTHLFDDRGVPPVPLTLLREGRVDARFLDPSSARRLETRPTGHLHGGRLRPSNLQMRSGTRSMNAILSDLGGGVLKVFDLPDLAGLDPVTGDLTVVVSGLWMQGPDAVAPVRDVRLSGNLVDILREVVEVASDTDRVAHVDAPGLLVDGFVAS